MCKFYFLAVTYGIAFLLIGVCLRKLEYANLTITES